MGVSPALYGPVAAYQGVAGASAQLGRENRSNSAKIEEISARRGRCHYAAQRIGLLSGGESAQHVGV